MQFMTVRKGTPVFKKLEDIQQAATNALNAPADGMSVYEARIIGNALNKVKRDMTFVMYPESRRSFHRNGNEHDTGELE